MKTSIRKCVLLGSLAWIAAGMIVIPTKAAFWSLSGDLNSHDPAIVNEGGTWWIARTWGAGIGMEWSSDGHAWNTGTPIFQNGLSWWGQYNGNSTWTWAPSLVDYNGRALCYYAVSTFGSQTSAIGLATASSISTGNWTDQGAIITSAPGGSYNAIDPCFTTDASGNPWLSFGSFWNGIYLTALTSSGLPTGPQTRIAYNSQGIENSQIIYNGGYYYLFASVGSCCDGASSTYHIVFGRATSITGPYYDMNGVKMLNGGGTTLDSGGGRYIAAGGESIFNNGGSWVCARHQLDSLNGYDTVLFINDLYWSGGWPTYYSSSVGNGTYEFLARHSGQAMETLGQGTGDGTQIDQYPYWGGSGQKWTVSNTGGSIFKIVGVQSGRSLDINNLSSTNGTKVQLWDYWGGAGQQWTFTPTDSGYYRVTPQCATGSCLDVAGASTNKNAIVQLWQYWGGNNQQWLLQTP